MRPRARWSLRTSRVARPESDELEEPTERSLAAFGGLLANWRVPESAAVNDIIPGGRSSCSDCVTWF